jgi:hypothetical protein
MTFEKLSLLTLGIVGAELVFWFYTFYYIGTHANPHGNGMQWLGEVPLTIVVVLLVLPALVLGVAGRTFAVAAQLGALVAVLAAAADVIVWSQVLGELAQKALH